jgi:AraC-like DNA-binding protein
MPGCVTSTFSEPHDFAAALRREGCRTLLITGQGQFGAHLTQIVLHRQRLSAAEEQLSRIAFIAVPREMALICFELSDGTDPVWGGISVQPGEIVMLGPGVSLHVRTPGPSRWGTICLPIETVSQYGTALTGAAFHFPSVGYPWRAQRMASMQLRRLHASAIRVARFRPHAVIDVEAAHGLEQQIVHAVIECLTTGSVAMTHCSARHHQEIMARFEQLLESQGKHRLAIAEFSEALGVSERLLRSLCHAHLGMSPTSYDRLCRLSLVRSILCRTDSDSASVAEVARRHGFSDLGRFAVKYHAAFGELPSTTLRQRHGNNSGD